MAGSQLKRLKASLRDQGIIGPQKSKKEKKRNAQDAQAKQDRRLSRATALEGIREQFNPFQFKMNARGPKFQVTTNKPQSASAAKGIKGRPGVALSESERRRRETLLVDLQRRHKVGGIIDRRFGEDDPDIADEDKALERFAREKQRHYRKSNIFDLEADGPAVELTHMGRPLDLDDDVELRDDFDEPDLMDDDEDTSRIDRGRLKRIRGDLVDDEDEADGLPERKKTKQEVYKEIIAKSKLHKYERQTAKDEDDDLRVQIDKELPDLQALLYDRNAPRGTNQATGDPSDPKSAAAAEKAAFDKAYDLRLRQLIQEKKAQPADRTKTEEELAEESRAQLEKLEQQRLKRMRGEEVSDEDDDSDSSESASEDGSEENDDDDAEPEDPFGLGQGIGKQRLTATELGFDDEDDFVIDDDLVTSGSDIDMNEDENDHSSDDGVDPDEDDEFTRGLLTEAERNDPVFTNGESVPDSALAGGDTVPFTLECPQTHAAFLNVVKGVPSSKVPTIIQRIRVIHHPKLDSQNKEKLANFVLVLIKHVVFLGNAEQQCDFAVVESIIRHIHSMAKMFPIEVAKECRAHIQDMQSTRPLALTGGDLLLLTAIGTVFPTSDHWHQVVTPAQLTMSRYLGMKILHTLADYATGSYISILLLSYQKVSKRYIPELLSFALNTLCSLAPEEPRKKLGDFPLHAPKPGIRTRGAQATQIRKLQLKDCHAQNASQTSDTESAKVAIISTTLNVITAAAELWSTKPAFEPFEASLRTVKHLQSKACRAEFPPALVQEIAKVASALERTLKVSQLARRPIELHHHKALAIKTHIPKFEDSFDPDKHYDTNRVRAEASKLRAEHKKERKGAMRELRKDAQFMAREKLKIKKVKDAAYHKWHNSLVSEIQGEEGRESNAYDREKLARKRARDRKAGR